jgi:hypothetical protein
MSGDFVFQYLSWCHIDSEPSDEHSYGFFHLVYPNTENVFFDYEYTFPMSKQWDDLVKLV